MGGPIGTSMDDQPIRLGEPLPSGHLVHRGEDPMPGGEDRPANTIFPQHPVKRRATGRGNIPVTDQKGIAIQVRAAVNKRAYTRENQLPTQAIVVQHRLLTQRRWNVIDDRGECLARAFGAGRQTDPRHQRDGGEQGRPDGEPAPWHDLGHDLGHVWGHVWVIRAGTAERGSNRVSQHQYADQAQKLLVAGVGQRAVDQTQKDDQTHGRQA